MIIDHLITMLLINHAHRTLAQTNDMTLILSPTRTIAMVIVGDSSWTILSSPYSWPIMLTESWVQQPSLQQQWTSSQYFSKVSSSKALKDNWFIQSDFSGGGFNLAISKYGAKPLNRSVCNCDSDDGLLMWKVQCRSHIRKFFKIAPM